MILGLKNSVNATAQLNIATAYFLWRANAERNIAIGHLNVLKNYSHDPDLTIYLQELVEDYQKEDKLLTNHLNKYSVSTADPSPRDLNIKSKTSGFADQDIAEVVYRFLRLDVAVLLQSFRYPQRNDEEMAFLMQLAKKAIARVGTFIKYIKLKNWVFLPPVYPSIPQGVTEKAAINEILLLWDHLIYEYTVVRQIQLYLLYIQDHELKTMLHDYHKQLLKTAKTIEDELLYFGVVLPNPYKDETAQPINTENYDDKLIFNSFLHGLQDGISLHGIALQEIILNDRLRDFFTKITYDEFEFYLRLEKLGRTKGWANTVPAYKMI